MKRFPPLALAIALIAFPACAQHGASHGGFSGHASASSRGGFSAPSRSSGYRPAPAMRVPALARGFQGSYRGNPGARPPYTGSWRYRRPYFSPNRAGFSYILPGYGWASPYYLGNPDFGYDDSTDQQGATSESYSGPLAPYSGDYQDQTQQPGPPPPYQPNAALAPSPQPDEEAVTLIFKDGRPAEQIHNYLLTRTTLFVGGQHQRAIPTDQLDLDATERVNHDLGVDFQLPATLK